MTLCEWFSPNGFDLDYLQPWINLLKVKELMAINRVCYQEAVDRLKQPMPFYLEFIAKTHPDELKLARACVDPTKKELADRVVNEYNSLPVEDRVQRIKSIYENLKKILIEKMN